MAHLQDAYSPPASSQAMGAQLPLIEQLAGFPSGTLQVSPCSGARTIGRGPRWQWLLAQPAVRRRSRLVERRVPRALRYGRERIGNGGAYDGPRPSQTGIRGDTYAGLWNLEGTCSGTACASSLSWHA
jgi:hypothetical protein